mgnify:CR=1 FL=1
MQLGKAEVKCRGEGEERRRKSGSLLDLNLDLNLLLRLRPFASNLQHFLTSSRRRLEERLRTSVRRKMNDGLGGVFCYKRSRNCSTVSPASRTIPPRVKALTGLWRGIVRMRVPFDITICFP